MSGWPQKPLLEVARLTRGTEPGSASYTDFSRGVRFLRVGDITGKTNNPAYTDAAQTVLVSETDVLLALDGSPGYVSTGHTGAISSGLRKVDPIDPNKVSLDWLRYSLMSPDVQHIIGKYTNGVTILHASSAVPHISIPIPPLSEQNRVVQILDETDQLRQLRAEGNRRMTAISQALFAQLLARNDGQWEKARLEDLCSAVEDCPHSTPAYAEGKTAYPCVRSSDIQEGKFDWSITKHVDAVEYKNRVRRLVPKYGDVIYCREGARLGNAAIIPEGITLCLGQRMMLFRPASGTATGEVIWALLHSEHIRQQVALLVGGAASPHLNVGDIKSFDVIVPPYSLQIEFSSRIHKMRELESAQALSLQRLDDLFQSLLHRAFLGEL